MERINVSRGAVCAGVHSLRVLFLMCLVVPAFMWSCAPRVQKEVPGAMVTLVVGDVKVKVAGGAPVPAAVGMKLLEGQSIETGDDGFISVQLGNECIVQIRAKSAVSVTSLFKNGRNELYLEKGRLLTRVEKLGKGQQYIVKTPTVIAAVRGTQFSVSQDAMKGAVALEKGVVEVTGIKTGEKIEVKEGKAVDVTDSVRVRAVTKVETREFDLLKAVKIVPLEKAGEKEKAEALKQSKEAVSSIEKIEKDLRSLEGADMTLEGLKAKYGRIDYVTDYRGMTYAGVILSRGDTYRIQTPTGIVTVPAKTVKNTRTVR